MFDLRPEGYWYSEYEPEYPVPVALELSEEEANNIYSLIVEKEKSAFVRHYRGMSKSRITGALLGSTEFNLDGWKWPVDFAPHYVRDHRVRPSDDFLKFIGYDKDIKPAKNPYVIDEGKKVDSMDVLIKQMTREMANNIEKEVLNDLLKMKVIIVNTPKGQFSLPLRPVAEDRANYYAVEADGHEKGSKEWEEEVQVGMNDDYEVIDWILNNSDWENWEDQATQINEDVLVTDEDFWTSSDNFEIEN